MPPLVAIGVPIDSVGRQGGSELAPAAVRAAKSAGERRLVLGGWCGLVPGALAGLRDAAGPAGVAYVDGHVDVYDAGRRRPARRPTSRWPSRSASAPQPCVEAAGGPSAQPERVVVLGARDPEEAAEYDPSRAYASTLRPPGDVSERQLRALGRSEPEVGRSATS